MKKTLFAAILGLVFVTRCGAEDSHKHYRVEYKGPPTDYQWQVSSIIDCTCEDMAGIGLSYVKLVMGRDVETRLIECGNVMAARSKTTRLLFAREHPCPATGARRLPCPGYVIDHIVPLCAGGPDAVHNMQWQTVPEAKIKDGWERAVCRVVDKTNEGK